MLGGIRSETEANGLMAYQGAEAVAGLFAGGRAAITRGALLELGKSSSALTLRADIQLFGGRSGAKTAFLSGPANSVVLGGGSGRIFITNNFGQVISDITFLRVKDVIPGVGASAKRAPSPFEIEALVAMGKK
jgi:hypothetical protein